jgi:hypothetical protein
MALIVHPDHDPEKAKRLHDFTITGVLEMTIWRSERTEAATSHD